MGRTWVSCLWSTSYRHLISSSNWIFLLVIMAVSNGRGASTSLVELLVFLVNRGMGVHLLMGFRKLSFLLVQTIVKPNLGEQISLKAITFQPKPTQGQPNKWDIDPIGWNPLEIKLKGVPWTIEPSLQ